MKKLIFVFTLCGLTGCLPNYSWYLPSGGTTTQFYRDKNACMAESKRVTGNEFDTYYQNCMKARGYTEGTGGSLRMF